MNTSNLTFEEYAMWARSRYPQYAQEAEEAAVSTARTVAPVADEVCPVTLRSSRSGVVLTPRRSR